MKTIEQMNQSLIQQLAFERVHYKNLKPVSYNRMMNELGIMVVG